MNKENWASYNPKKLTQSGESSSSSSKSKNKQMGGGGAATSASSSASYAASTTSTTTGASVSASMAMVQRMGPAGGGAFIIPVPGHNGALAGSLYGKTMVMTGVFPEVGGGDYNILYSLSSLFSSNTPSSWYLSFSLLSPFSLPLSSLLTPLFLPLHPRFISTGRRRMWFEFRKGSGQSHVWVFRGMSDRISVWENRYTDSGKRTRYSILYCLSCRESRYLLLLVVLVVVCGCSMCLHKLFFIVFHHCTCIYHLSGASKVTQARAKNVQLMSLKDLQVGYISVE